jgi:glycosyltransferase involved in cell wall biosynthesis
MHKYDLAYATVDSLSEGVGSSQIAPLMERLANEGMKINLLTFEKVLPPISLIDKMKKSGVEWTQIPFGDHGSFGGMARTLKLAKILPDSTITHARSDFPAVAARISGKDLILWDVRSLWADQRKFIEENSFKRGILSMYSPIESLACNSAKAMSTLTKSVIPVLQERHNKLPSIKTVVPTAVDLGRFKFSPIMPKNLKGLYSGTYNKYYDLDLSRKFVEVLKNLVTCEVDWAKPKESQISFLNAGEKFIFSVSQPEMANVISDYSFGISICKENAGDSLKAAMPTKIAEFLSVGRPVIVNPGLGDCDEILLSEGVGVTLSRGDNLERRAIELIEICKDKETPLRCREVALKYFSLDTGVNNYLNVYQCMLS